MHLKVKLRKKYLDLRKEKYYDVDKNFFYPLLKLIKKKIKKNLLELLYTIHQILN